MTASNEHNNAPAVPQGEPFGYFRAEPFGWTDCAEDDEGAIALYERPQEVGLTDAWLLEQFKHHPNWELSTSNDPECDQNLFWLVHEVKGGRNDREWSLIGEGATPRHAIIAALRAKGQS